jgi:hypothetical protein
MALQRYRMSGSPGHLMRHDLEDESPGFGHISFGESSELVVPLRSQISTAAPTETDV